MTFGTTYVFCISNFNIFWRYQNPSQFSENIYSTSSHTCNIGSYHLSSRKQSLAYAVWRVIPSYAGHSSDLCIKMGSVAKYLYMTLHKIKFIFSCLAVYSYVCAPLMQEVLHLFEHSLHTWQVKKLRCWLVCILCVYTSSKGSFWRSEHRREES